MWGWVNLTGIGFLGMNRFPRFNMVVEAPPLLEIGYNDLDRDHRRTLNKYVCALTQLTNMNSWPEIIKVLVDYWDNEKMVFQFLTMEITPTIEKLRDYIDMVGIGLERRVENKKIS